MSKKALLVARVSTGKQKDNYSPETQLDAMSCYAREHGFDEACEVKDVISGTVPIYQRPGGSEIYRAIQAKSIDAVVFYTFDRASRDDDAIDFMILRRDLRQAGIELHIVREGGRLGDDFVSGLMAYLGVARAGQERQAITERTSRGRNGKAKNGRVVGSGKPPYGYTYSDGQFTVVEAEAATIRLIFDWYVNGDETGKRLSTRKIAARLNDMGVLSPSAAKNYSRKARVPGLWAEGSVWWTIRNETLCGTWRYGKHIGKGGRGGLRAIGDTMPVTVPAIVSRATWEAAQARSKANKRSSRRNGKRLYLLRQLIECQCGRHMYGTENQYRCSNNYDHITHCDVPRIPAQVIEDWAWEAVLDALRDSDRLDQEWHLAQRAEAEALKPNQSALEAVNEFIAQCQQEAADIADGLKHAKGLVAANLEAQQESVNARYEKLSAQREKLLAALEAEPVYTDAGLAAAQQIRADILAGLNNPTEDDKRNYFEWLRVRIIIKDGQATPTCLLPIKGKLDLVTSRSTQVNVALTTPTLALNCKPLALSQWA